MEVALKEDHTKQVQKMNLLSVVGVVDCASQSSDYWSDDQVCNFLNEIFILVD